MFSRPYAADILNTNILIMKKWFGLVICLMLCSIAFANGADSAATQQKKPNIKYGIASFYSKSLDGTKTSTGETFRHANFTAASNGFKLNTWVRVTNLRNGKSIIVRINDRMHKTMALNGRIVDLSIAGAQKLDFIKRGIVRVKVEEVPPGTTE